MRDDSLPFPPAAAINREQLISKAYDTELLERCGKLLIDTVTNHFRDLQSGQLPVQDWRRPEDNVSEALNWLEQTESDADLASVDDASRRFCELVKRTLSRGQNLHHPRYIGHQVPASMPMAGLFDAVTTLTNQVQGVYEMGPWGVSVERAVLRRIAEVIGFDVDRFGGLVTSGGSLANLTALLAARNQAIPEFWTKGCGRITEPPVIVVHGEAHYCVDRAAGVMGLGTDQIVRVPVNNSRQMDPGHLDRILADLRSRDIPIVAVVAVSCSTPTGAFDDLEAISSVCRKHQVWLHVDAAHGGALCFSHQHRHLVAGLHLADSVVVDAHKMMFLPAVCAMVFYQNKEHRFSAFQQTAPYLFDPSAPDMAEYDNAVVTFDCTKRAAAIGLWGVWSMFGPQLFEALVDQVVEVTQQLYALISSDESIEAFAPPSCNILAYRFFPKRLRESSREDVDQLQLGIRRRLLETGIAYVTQTRLDNKIYLRSTIMNPLTTEADLRAILSAIRDIGDELIKIDERS